MSRDHRREEVRAIYCRGLPDSVQASDLNAQFDKFGPISDIYIPKDYHSQRPRGFAYIK